MEAQKLFDLRDKIMETARNAVKERLSGLLRQGVYTAERTCEDTVTRFELKEEVKTGRMIRMHWSTYRAVCSRYGIFKSQGNVETEPINWNEQLAGKLTEIMVPSWNQIFNNDIPRLCEPHAVLIHSTVVEFTKQLMEVIEAVAPRIRGPLRRMGENYLHLEGELQDSTRTILSGLQDTAKEIHRKVTPLVLETLEEAYDHCSAESGRIILHALHVYYLTCE
jgi:hypothetical protein